MPYGDDITEGIPYNLSNPTGASRNFQLTGESYDVSIGGLPFYIMSSDETPYRRQTAQYRKQQIDQTNEAGEQTLTGWWLRSQSSFHSGDGINFYDPAAGETVQYRFADSRGVDVWKKGEVSLLNDSTESHNITGVLASNGKRQQELRSIKWGSTEGVLLLDEYDVDKIAKDGTLTHFIDYTAGAGVFPVYAICDDGTYAYWYTNATSGGTTKQTMYKKPLTGSSASTADEVKMFDATGSISNGVMEYVKERIILCADNKVYEVTTSATALPTPIFTHPSTTHVFTSVAASGPAIYVAGYNGIQSTIMRFVLNASGTLPTLTSAIIAAELPVGEVAHRIFYYLGYMIIGTNKGVRVAQVLDDGSLVYGPLTIETTQPVYDFAAKDTYIWCAAGVEGSPGLVRIDLSNQLDTLRFAWANDVYYPSKTGVQTTAVAFANGTDQLVYATKANSVSDLGYVYIESDSVKIASGYITTGRIRYNTLESKLFKLLTVRLDNVNGGLTVKSIGPDAAEYNIGGFAEDDIISELSVSYPAGSQEFLSFKFTLTRSETDNTGTPILKGYQVKSLPAVPRQRLIQYPLACYDNEKDTYGTVSGYENSAYERLTTIEALENIGDSIRVEDYRNGESYVGLIEEIQFLNRTPSDKRFSGFGGVLYVTIRSL